MKKKKIEEITFRSQSLGWNDQSSICGSSRMFWR